MRKLDKYDMPSPSPLGVFLAMLAIVFMAHAADIIMIFWR